jgi:L-amino acid N-acyltransferase YncA
MPVLSRALRKLVHNPIVEWVRTDRHLVVYCMDGDEARKLPADPAFRVNDEGDIAGFEQTESWLGRDAFIAGTRERIAGGNRIYTFAENGVLLHYGWLVPRQVRAWFPYVRQHFNFPPETSVLFNFYSHPRARGRGLYQRAMARIAHDAATETGARHIYIAVEAPNRASRHTVVKTGFRPAAVPYLKRRFGKTETGVLAPDAFAG